MCSQTNSNNISCTTAIILTTSTKETHFDASPNISNRKHLHHGSNSTQIPPYDFASSNANSGAANMTNTLTFVCHNHIKYQITQNQLIDLQETSKHDSILLYCHKQTRTHKTAITTINKIDHFNSNATSQTTKETHKRPTINHHGNLAKNNLVKTTNRHHKRSHNQITLIPIIILTVRNINHLIKHNNDGHHINNNHNNLLTIYFHHATIIRDHHQMTDDNKTLFFVPITSKRSNKKLKLSHYYMRKHLQIPPSSQNNKIFHSRKYSISTTYFTVTIITMWFYFAT